MRVWAEARRRRCKVSRLSRNSLKSKGAGQTSDEGGQDRQDENEPVETTTYPSRNRLIEGVGQDVRASSDDPRSLPEVGQAQGRVGESEAETDRRGSVLTESCEHGLESSVGQREESGDGALNARLGARQREDDPGHRVVVLGSDEVWIKEEAP